MGENKQAHEQNIYKFDLVFLGMTFFVKVKMIFVNLSMIKQFYYPCFRENQKHFITISDNYAMIPCVLCRGTLIAF